MLFLLSQLPTSPDIWQTFGLLAAFVAVVGMFLWYLVRKDKADETRDARLVRAMDELEKRSSEAHVKAAVICAEAERERIAAAREMQAALGRASVLLDQHERRAKQ